MLTVPGPLRLLLLPLRPLRDEGRDVTRERDDDRAESDTATDLTLVVSASLLWLLLLLLLSRGADVGPRRRGDDEDTLLRAGELRRLDDINGSSGGVGASLSLTTDGGERRSGVDAKGLVSSDLCCNASSRGVDAGLTDAV